MSVTGYHLYIDMNTEWLWRNYGIHDHEQKFCKVRLLKWPAANWCVAWDEKVCLTVSYCSHDLVSARRPAPHYFRLRSHTHFNIILVSTPTLSSGFFLAFIFSRQLSTFAISLTACCMLRLSDTPWFFCPVNICRKILALLLRIVIERSVITVGS